MRKLLSKILISVLIILLAAAHVPARSVFADEGQTGEVPVTENAGENSDTADEAIEESEDASAEAVYDVSEEKSVKAEVKESEELVKETAEKQKLETEEKEKEPRDYVDVRAEIETFDSTGYVYNGQEQTYGGSDTYKIRYYLDKEEVSREDIEALGFDVDIKAYHMDDSLDEDFHVSGTDHGEYYFDVVVIIKGEVEGYETKGEFGNTVTLSIEQAPVTVTYKGIDEEIVYDAKEHKNPGYTREINDGGLGLYKEEYIVHKASAEKLITYTNVGSYSSGVTQKYLDSTARNTNNNFAVTFVADQGTLEIKPATITVKTESARLMSDGTDTQTLECHEYTVDGFLNDYYEGLYKVTWTGKQVGLGNSLNECEFEITDEKIANNYVIAYDFGTLAIYSQNSVQVIIRPAEEKVPYNGDTQYVRVPVEVFIDNGRYDSENIRYNGSNELVLGEDSYLVVDAKDAGDYTVALNTADFENTDSSFEVEFVIEGEALLHVTPAYASVVIGEVTEEHLYTGKEFTIPAYEVLEVNYRDDDAPEYDTANIAFNGKKELKGTDYGMYWEVLSADKFENTNKNFNVEFVFASMGNHVSILTISRPGVVVTLKGNEFHVPYDENQHVLTVNADGSVLLDGKKQSKAAFEVTDIKADEGVSFNAADLYFRQELTTDGSERGYYYVNNWLNYLSNSNQDIDISYFIEEDIALVVDKTPLTLVVDDLTVRFGDKDELTAHYEGLIDGFDGPQFSLYLEEIVDHAGEYEIFADIIERSDIYEVTDIKTGTLTVARRPLTISVTGAKQIVEYDGQEHELSGYTVAYSEEVDDPIEKPASPIVKGTEIGEYALDLSGLDFSFSSSIYDVTVEKTDGMLKIVADADPIDLGTIGFEGGEYVFDGKEHPASMNTSITKDGKTYTLSGVSFVYYEGETEIGNTAPVDAGNYTVKVNKENIRVIDEDGYDVTGLCSFDVQESASLVITPRPVTVYITTEKKKIIGGNGNMNYYARYSIDVEGNPGNSADFTIDDVTYNGQDYAVGNAGGINPPLRYTCQLYLNRFGTSNNNYTPVYKFSDGDNGLIILLIRYPGQGAITYLTLDLTNGETGYNGQPQTFKPEIDGLNDDNTIRVRGSDGVYYTVTINPDRFISSITKTAAGEYSAAPGSMPNGIISIVDSSGIDCRDTVSFKYNGGRFTITKQVLNVTLRTDIEKTYGEADPDYSTWIIVEGLEDWQSVSSIFKFTRKPGEDVGEYPFTVSLISSGPGGWGGGEVIKGDERKIAKSVEAEEAISEYAEEKEDELSEEAGGSTATNTNFVVNYRNNEGKLTIKPAVITITAVDDSKWYGTNDPVFTAIITGLVGNEHLPSGFYTEYRDPGEAIRDDYVIHIEADPDSFKEPEYPPMDDPDVPVICLDCEIICKDCGMDEVKEYDSTAEYAARSAKARKVMASERLSDKAEAVEIIVRPEIGCEDSSMCEELPWQPFDPIPFDPEPIVIPTSGGGSGVFKSYNYTYVLVNGLFAIYGNNVTTTVVTPSDPPADPPVTRTDPTPDPEPVVEVINTDPAPKSDGPVEIITDPTPAAIGGRAWALVNLICTVLSCLIAICMIVTIKRREDEEEEETSKQEIRDDKEEKEEEDDRKRSKLLGLIPSIGSIIAFILTEDMRLPMILVDKWTLLMLILLAVTILLAYFTRHKDKDEEDKGEELKVEMAS